MTTPLFQRHPRSPWLLALLLGLWLALAGNLPFWRTVWGLPELAGARGVVFSVGLVVWIALAVMVLLSLFAWPRVFKAVAIFLLFSAAASTYFMLQYGVVIDATMMANVANTDPREVRDLLSWQLVACLVVLALLPSLWLLRQRIAWRRVWPQTWRNGLSVLLWLVALVAVTVLIYQDLASLMRNHKEVRYLVNPLNSLYASGKLVADQLPRASRTMLPMGEDAHLGASYQGQARTPLVVLVVGETARAANFSLGGYARPTNPELAQLANTTGGMTYYSAVRSCGTNTQASVPCIFSALGKQQFEASNQPRENLLDMLQRAGLAVLWLDNQSGCKGVCDRVPNVTTRTLEVPGLCEGGECLDEVMQKDLDARIAALDPARRARGVVVVMHQMGSHGPAYFRRAPPAQKHFLPECTSNVLQDCPREQLVNAYDNSIVYTDHVLASLAHWLDQKARDGAVDTAMLYFSDHGESLGENNIYLHGLPYALAPDTQTHIPMLSWLSPAMQKRSGVRLDCLQQNAGAALSHDNVFHGMLGLLDVQTTLYKKEMDWMARCR